MRPTPSKSSKEADQRAAYGADVMVQTVLGLFLVAVFFGLVVWMFAVR